ncbi:ty1-copia retrotransposon protein [Cucumis melo var. makuwa]|uniref:Ty1-copia retrotransposon protein n=1 Tax=Cucumis melo var. makuwa TaxID=1194695 RepID=A0A5D3CST3_CUCMM|nr:ty1-copia retrotransposon protein [Cucumis melo var. makuwa]
MLHSNMMNILKNKEWNASRPKKTVDLPSSDPPVTTSTSSDPESSTGPPTIVAVADQVKNDQVIDLEKYAKDNKTMTDDKPVVEQIHEYENLVANVLSKGMKMCEILQANVLLEKFLPSWNDYRNHLKHKKKDLKLKELISHMRTEEANRLKDKLATKNLNSVNANLVELSIVNRDRTKQEKGYKGKNSEKRQFKAPGGQIKKKKLVCYVCGKEGQKLYQCNQRKERPSQKPTPQANLAEQDKPRDTSAPIENFSITTKTLSMENACSWETQPLHENLVSESLLNRTGLKIILEGGKVALTKNEDFIGKGYLSNGLFVLNTISMNANASSSAYVIESVNLWHGRLGYVNFVSTRKLKDLRLINTTKSHETDKCPICVESKFHKKPFKPVESRTTDLLELIHSDLANFRTTTSRGGKNYYVSFVDDYSRFTKIYLIKTKDEAGSMFLKFKAQSENQLRKKIKRLRSDRGGEYSDKTLKDFCESNGIIHEFTAPYSPQQNGIAERKNRTLKEMMNTMLLSSGLSDNMWEEAVLSVCFVLNKIPHKRDAEFFEHVFPLKQSLSAPSLSKRMHDPENPSIISETPVSKTVNTSNLRCELELRRSKRQRTEKSFGLDFLSTFIVERCDEIDYNFTNLYLIDEDPKTYQEALNSVESMRTPFNASKHLKKNKGDSVSQPEYAKIIGSVMYLMNYTKPDIAYAVSRLSRYTHNPDRYHWDALRHLLRYLKGTIDYCLHFNKFSAVLEGYCDANWVTDNDEVNSTSGYVFLLGGGAISWKSAKQTCIARSTTESEFIALEFAGHEAEWIKNLLGDVSLSGTSIPVSIKCDSQAAICTAKNSVYNGKSRHIRLRHVVVKQLLKEGTISLEFVRFEKNLADPLTKGLTRKVVIDSSVNMGLKPFGDP